MALCAILWQPITSPGGRAEAQLRRWPRNLAVVALGTDTGGSVRQPGSFCGVTALNPSYGRVSRYGLIAYASSLDRIGPFAHTARDVADVMSVIAGRDPCDSTSASAPVPDYVGGLGETLARLAHRHPGRLFRRRASTLKCARKSRRGSHCSKSWDAGVYPSACRIREYAIAAYYIIATAEASSNLARYDGVRYGPRVPGATLIEMYQKTRGRGFGAEVKRRIVLGTYVLSAGYYDAYYLKGQKVRALIATGFPRSV